MHWRSVQKAFLAIGIISALVFSGSRLRLARDSGEVLRFAHTFTTESERAIIDEVVREFEHAHPGMRVQQLVSNSEVYQSIGWRLQLRGRHPPDVFFQWDGYKVDAAVANGWALELTGRVRPGFIQEFVPASVRRIGGGVYFLPQSIDLSNLVWYNREIFEKLNLREPQNFEDWLNQCERVRRAGYLPLGQGNRDLWPMGNFAAELVGREISDSRLKELFAPSADIGLQNLSGLNRFIALRDAGAFEEPRTLPRGAAAMLSDIDAKVLFLTGKSAQHIVGSWFLADIQDAREKNDLRFPVGVFAVPGTGGHGQKLMGVRTGFLVSRTTRNPAAAVDLVERLLSRECQRKFGALGTLSLRRDAADFTTDPTAKQLLEMVRAAPGFVPPPDTGFEPEEANLFYQVCGKTLSGGWSVADAARTWERGKEKLRRKGL